MPTGAAGDAVYLNSLTNNIYFYGVVTSSNTAAFTTSSNTATFILTAGEGVVTTGTFAGTLGYTYNYATSTTSSTGTDQYDWGGNLIAVLQDSFGITVNFKLLQLMNADVQRAAHGTDNVTVVPPTTNTGTTIQSTINAQLLDTGSWVIDAYYMKMSMRFVIPYGRPTQVGKLTWVHKALAMYDLTIRPLPDNYNNHAYEYWNDGVPI